MVNTISTAASQEALNVESAKIMVGGKEWGFATGITVDGKSPIDLINCISGTLRRKKPRTTDWSCDAVVLYDNIWNLQELTNEQSFDIIVTMVNLKNPSDKTSMSGSAVNTIIADNIWQQLTIQGCEIEAHTINITDSSTFKMNGKAVKRYVNDATSM